MQISTVLLVLLSLLLRPTNALFIRHSRRLPTALVQVDLAHAGHANETFLPSHRPAESSSQHETAATVSPYYLLWSPGVLPKFMASAVVLGVAHFALLPLVVAPSSTVTSSWFQQLLLPLFASACCLIQLVLNALSIGCAGFNKRLGPCRPVFISLMLYLSFFSHSSRIIDGAWRWGIALLPEILHGWNELVRMRQRKVHPSQQQETVLNVHVPTMGCVACIHGVQNAVSKVPGVHSVTATLSSSNGGDVVVVMSKETNRQQILNVMETAGFAGASIVS